MDEKNKTLSQDDIDALVGKFPNMKQASPLAADETVTAGPGPAVTAPPPSQPAAAPATANSLQSTVADLADRLVKIETAIAKLNQQTSSPAEPKAMTQQLQKLSSQVEAITANLKYTAGYNIGKVFKCDSCGTTNAVAIPVKCTGCGQQKWWGWWPKK